MTARIDERAVRRDLDHDVGAAASRAAPVVAIEQVGRVAAERSGTPSCGGRARRSGRRPASVGGRDDELERRRAPSDALEHAARAAVAPASGQQHLAGQARRAGARLDDDERPSRGLREPASAGTRRDAGAAARRLARRGACAADLGDVRAPRAPPFWSGMQAPELVEVEVGVAPPCRARGRRTTVDEYWVTRTSQLAIISSALPVGEDQRVGRDARGSRASRAPRFSLGWSLKTSGRPAAIATARCEEGRGGRRA